MSQKGLIINNELFTMRYLFIMKLIVPQVEVQVHLLGLEALPVVHDYTGIV